MSWEEKTLSRETVYTGRIINVRRERVVLPNGREATREIVEHRGAVVIVPLSDADEVMLVQQYRKPVGSLTWELPAGTLEEGETALACAQRELREETGLEAREWRRVIEFFSSPGFCTEKMYLFWALGLREVGQAPDGDEQIVCRRFPLAEALAMARRGEIADAKSLVGLLTAAYWR
ncbi:MAG: NUDIX hydrolase [Clostridia bacterium]|nr:NUDIX hydrolase [Clostridia bacterium]